MQKTRSRIVSWAVLLGTVLLMHACAPAPEGGSDEVSMGSPLQVTIRPLDTILSIDDELPITVTIRNHGSQEEVWGSGSSHCRLSLWVVVEGEALEAGPPRRCTMDMVQYRLAPGEEYTATLPWDGTVLRNGQLQSLPPGDYELYGQGGATRSATSVIHLQDSE